MNAVDMALRQLDDLWGHEWDSLTSVLRGLTEEEARWRAPCYAGLGAAAGEPEPGTILWQIAHVASCKREYASLFDAVDVEPGSPASPNGLSERLRDLRLAHEEERAALAALRGTDLERPLRNGQTMSGQIGVALRHDAWHAGQIALARRLWRTR
jgi:hypothetical protein